MRRIFLVLGLCCFISGCASVNPFAGISSPPSEPKKLANYAQSEKQVPLKVGMTPDGKDVIAYATERTYSANSSETPEKLGFIQKLGRWIGGLSFLAFVFIVVSLLFFGGAPIVFIYKKYLDMRRALANTVQAIEDMPRPSYQELRPILSAHQDEADKKLIKQIKVEL